MKKSFLFCLIVLFCFSFSGCETKEENMLKQYDFYNANYGDSFNDVKAIEGLEFIGEDIKDFGTSYIDFNGKFFGLDWWFSYRFEDGKLDSLHVSLEDNKVLYDTDKTTEIFEKIAETFDKVYGKSEDYFDEIEEFKYIDKVYAYNGFGIGVKHAICTNNSYCDTLHIFFYKN